MSNFKIFGIIDLNDLSNDEIEAKIGTKATNLFMEYHKRGFVCFCWNCKKEATKLAQYTDGAREPLWTFAHHDKLTGKVTLFNRDHIVPRTANGSDNLINLRPSCFNCNSARSAIMTEEEIIFAQTVPGAIVDNQQFIHPSVKQYPVALVQRDHNCASDTINKAINRLIAIAEKMPAHMWDTELGKQLEELSYDFSNNVSTLMLNQLKKITNG